MTPTEYQCRALRTVNPTQSHRDNLANFALGLAGESIEFLDAHNRQERLKESGDICWYMAAICHATNTPFAPLWENPHDPVCFGHLAFGLRIVKPAGFVAESLKKHLYHGHAIPDLQIPLRTLAHLLHWQAIDDGSTIAEVMAMNVAKLEARYPNGFTVQASRERTDFGSAPK